MMIMMPAISLLFLLLFASVPIPGYTLSPFDLGYEKGCSDAKISKSSDRYINEPENAASSSSSIFMDGYRSGFSACVDDQDDDQSGNSESQSIRQPQFNSQNGK
jgi:hypothetical protein